MMIIVQTNFFLYPIGTGKMEWGVSGRERKREREKQIKGERESTHR
jgi:hypothetical protein